MRQFIAEYLDKNPEYCWAELALWMMGHRPFWSIIFNNEFYKNQICRKGNSGTPYAYCNKCEITGRFYYRHRTDRVTGNTLCPNGGTSWWSKPIPKLTKRFFQVAVGRSIK